MYLIQPLTVLNVLEIAKILFQNQMKTDTKSVAFSWLLNFEPYCYCEEELKKELL